MRAVPHGALWFPLLDDSYSSDRSAVIRSAAGVYPTIDDDETRGRSSTLPLDNPLYLYPRESVSGAAGKLHVSSGVSIAGKVWVDIPDPGTGLKIAFGTSYVQIAGYDVQIAVGASSKRPNADTGLVPIYGGWVPFVAEFGVSDMELWLLGVERASVSHSGLADADLSITKPTTWTTDGQAATFLRDLFVFERTLETWEKQQLSDLDEEWFAPSVPSGLDADVRMPWRVPILPTVEKADLTTGTWGDTADAGQIFGIYMGGGFAQNDELGWDLVLAAGTWEFFAYMVNAADSGIVSVRLDGVEVGTLDLYNGSTQYNQQKTLSSIAVTTTGKHRLSLKMATKNASSSGYRVRVTNVLMRRTA